MGKSLYLNVTCRSVAFFMIVLVYDVLVAPGARFTKLFMTELIHKT